MSGLVRARVSAPDGRMLTVRYCRAGALVGAATLFAEATRPFAIQALTDSGVLTLRPLIVRQLATREVRVANALLAETSARVLSFLGSSPAVRSPRCGSASPGTCSTWRPSDRHGPELVAAITQQELAELPARREVVVRVLRELRQEGVVHTGPHGITILKPERLFAAAQPQGGTRGSDTRRRREMLLGGWQGHRHDSRKAAEMTVDLQTDTWPDCNRPPSTRPCSPRCGAPARAR